jgi:hypothetical protein
MTMRSAAQLTSPPSQGGWKPAGTLHTLAIYLGSVFGSTGYCGIADGRDCTGPCPFCGGPRHETAWGDPGRCPDYRLRLNQP